jgi:alkaline phosphatase
MKYLKFSLIAVAVIGLNGCLLGGDTGSNGVEGEIGKTGADGQNGSPGVNSLVMQTNLAVGDTDCPNSGVQFDSGIDTDASGSLEISEITNTNYVCVPGVTSVSFTQLLSSLNNDWFIDGAALVSANKNTWLTATSSTGVQSNLPDTQQVTNTRFSRHNDSDGKWC